jgi:hypothetical protein
MNNGNVYGVSLVTGDLELFLERQAEVYVGKV